MKFKIIFIIVLMFLAMNSFAGKNNISSLKGVSKVKLNNGLTVLLKENHSQPLVSVQVWIKVGSVCEKENQKGLTHFLEHLLFKGTKNYPGDEISRKVEAQGGIINAGTSKEFTHYHIDIQSDAAEEAVKILADAMANAVLPEKEIEKERPVVIEEIVRHNDNPGAVLYDNFSQVLFLKTPYNYNVLGSSTVIKNATREEIENYYRSWYIPENMFLTIAGDIDSKSILLTIMETFGRQKSSKIPNFPDLAEEKHGPNDIITKRDVEHGYLLAGFIGPDLKSSEQFSADITSIILGGGRSSRLYRKLREKKKLVYAISSSFYSQRGSGAIVFQSVFDPKNENIVLSELNREIQELEKNGPSDEELNRAKEMIKADWYFDQESFHDQAATVGYWNMQGLPQMPDKYIRNIEKITKKDVQVFLKNYFRSQQLSYALIIPEKK
ncbi:MAG: pitrilysin family protein [Elusimicrobia bacterium]|nr:pitrilysin family protein [Elusimicrobiota bacterium]